MKLKAKFDFERVGEWGGRRDTEVPSICTCRCLCDALVALPGDEIWICLHTGRETMARRNDKSSAAAAATGAMPSSESLSPPPPSPATQRSRQESLDRNSNDRLRRR